MTTTRQRTPFLCLITLIAFVCLQGCSNDAGGDWLTGRWIPIHNPLNESQDTLVFKADGKVTIETSDNRTIDGEYRIKDNFVILNLAVPKRPTQVRLMISKDHARLMYKNGAYFERRG